MTTTTKKSEDVQGATRFSLLFSAWGIFFKGITPTNPEDEFRHACMLLPPIAVRLCVLGPILWHMEEKSALGPTRSARVSLGMREAE